MLSAGAVSLECLLNDRCHVLLLLVGFNSLQYIKHWKQDLICINNSLLKEI